MVELIKQSRSSNWSSRTASPRPGLVCRQVEATTNCLGLRWGDLLGAVLSLLLSLFLCLAPLGSPVREPDLQNRMQEQLHVQHGSTYAITTHKVHTRPHVGTHSSDNGTDLHTGRSTRHDKGRVGGLVAALRGLCRPHVVRTSGPHLLQLVHQKVLLSQDQPTRGVPQYMLLLLYFSINWVWL